MRISEYLADSDDGFWIEEEFMKTFSNPYNVLIGDFKKIGCLEKEIWDACERLRIFGFIYWSNAHWALTEKPKQLFRAKSTTEG